MADPQKPSVTASATGPVGDLNPRTDPPLDFPDAPFGRLGPDDYRALGFLCGLEVHQQLATRRKLFCRCPAGRRAKGYDAEVFRRMRPTLSELGEYDGTALMEFKTRKEIVYRLDRGTVCTYELDDTPPFEIDAAAVRISLEIARLLNLNLVSELHVMRKQYLDGSIPTGFQRTAMVGLTGAIPFRVPELGVDRELRIRQLSLEEDSCREVSDIGHRITFHTDRLGTPLTEAVTEPDLFTPWEVEAGGRLLARVAQATGKVMRGAGAARQDVNVSVAGGRRVELKGVDSHRALPRLVHTEAFRQLNLLRVRDALTKRGVTAGMLPVPEGKQPWNASDLVVDAASFTKNCGFAPVEAALERGERVCAVRLPGFGGLLAHTTQPGVTFAREIEDRLRVIACLEARPFLSHSELDEDATLWRGAREALGADAKDDSIVLVWGPDQDAATAVREVLIRAGDALVGIPSETRQAFPDGTNGFERILPGPDRMYPDTDTPPLPLSDALLHEVETGRVETPWEREDRYASLGIGDAAARRLAAAPWAGLFDALEPGEGEAARRLAAALEKRLPHLRRSGFLDEIPPPERLVPLVRAIDAGEIRPEAMESALDALLGRPDASPDELLGRFRPAPDDEERLESVVADAARGAEELDGRPDEVRLRWAMGEVMPHFLGRRSPGKVRERLAEALAVSGAEVDS